VEEWQRLGEQIRKLRKRRGLTQQGLADKAGVSLMYVKLLETGARQSPSLDVLAQLARALDATLHVRLTERRTKRI
jgi:transcriptional regulator with XRE-family HTH domain